LGLSGELIDPLTFPKKGVDDLMIGQEAKPIRDTTSWKAKVVETRNRIKWGLGEEPPSVGPGPQPDYLRDAVGFPDLGPGIESKPFLFGRIYYPTDKKGSPKSDNMPLVIYLHEYSYSTGSAKGGNMIKQFVDEEYAVLIYDQVGFGTRVEEGRLFYERFPHWSKMGRMVSDVRWAVDALSEVDFINPAQIYTAGYSLGGTVALYSAALDKRIAGVISVSGFTPMRLDTKGKTAEGIYGYSHLHGLLPRLGFFIGEESRIPYDFHEILASIAPRPLLVIAPTWDQYASFPDVEKCVNEVTEVYGLFGAKENIKLYAPEEYDHLTDDMVEQMTFWLRQNLK